MPSRTYANAAADTFEADMALAIAESLKTAAAASASAPASAPPSPSSVCTNYKFGGKIRSSIVVSDAAVAASERVKTRVEAPIPLPGPIFVPSKHKKTPCKNGASCKFFKWGRCHFSHAKDDVAPAAAPQAVPPPPAPPPPPLELAPEAEAENGHDPRSFFECSICFAETNPVAFGCGHLAVCGSCAPNIEACPLCREPITMCVSVYF